MVSSIVLLLNIMGHDIVFIELNYVSQIGVKLMLITTERRKLQSNLSNQCNSSNGDNEIIIHMYKCC